MAPAYATSPRCFVTTTIDWGTPQYTRTSATGGTYTTADPDGSSGSLQPLTLTVQNTFLGSNTQLGSQNFNGRSKPNSCNCNRNLDVTTGTVGGTTSRGLSLHQSPKVDSSKTSTRTNANKSITTFTFSESVQNLSFTITDIDSATRDFVDAVAISGASYSGVLADSTYLQGDGSVGNPWRGKVVQALDDATSNWGNVTVTFPEVTSFQLHYWNQQDSSSPDIDGDQGIYLTNFRVTYNACP
ncbi:hypothetical protein [Janibacter massiliensis]|uniref:hypothetical protein n=1 Tax=Janibacter massiliensis TaxID=2058291 RepID=UPI00131A4ED5|nr:hypothetical protein [Janibacter massiliensis]